MAAYLPIGFAYASCLSNRLFEKETKNSRALRVTDMQVLAKSAL